MIYDLELWNAGVTRGHLLLFRRIDAKWRLHVRHSTSAIVVSRLLSVDADQAEKPDRRAGSVERFEVLLEDVDCSGSEAAEAIDRRAEDHFAGLVEDRAEVAMPLPPPEGVAADAELARDCRVVLAGHEELDCTLLARREDRSRKVRQGAREVIRETTGGFTFGRQHLGGPGRIIAGGVKITF